jgi:hypothetical protein
VDIPREGLQGNESLRTVKGVAEVRNEPANYTHLLLLEWLIHSGSNNKNEPMGSAADEGVGDKRLRLVRKILNTG